MAVSSRTVRIVAISAGVGILAYAATFLMPATYGSAFSLYFPSAAPPSILSGVRTSAESDMNAVRNFGGALVSPMVGSGTQTAVGILTSRTCLAEVVKELGLEGKWELNEPKAIKKLRGAFNASIDKNGFLVVESFANSPALAKQIVEALYGHLETRAGELTVNVSRKNREFIEERVKQQLAKVDTAQGRMVSLMAGADRAAFDKVQTAFNELRLKVEEAKVQEAAAKASLATAESNLRTLIKESRSYPNNMFAMRFVNESLQGLSTELMTRRQALEDTMAKFTQESAEFRGAQRNAKALEGFAQKVLDVQQKALEKGVTPQFAAAKAELAVLSTQIVEYEKLMRGYRSQLGRSADQYSRLERSRKEFEAEMDGLAALRKELELARIAEARDPSRFELVDPPAEDPIPLGPRRVLLAGVAFLLALAVQAWPAMASRLREDGV